MYNRLTAGLHYKEDPIYVFPEIKLHTLVPNFHIHVSVSDLYIPTIGPPVFLQQNRRTHHRYMNLGIGYETAKFLLWEYLFRIFGTVSFQCVSCSFHIEQASSTATQA